MNPKDQIAQINTVEELSIECPHCGEHHFRSIPIIFCEKCKRIFFCEFVSENSLAVKFSLLRPNGQAIVNYQPYVFKYLSYEGDQLKVKTIINRRIIQSANT